MRNIILAVLLLFSAIVLAQSSTQSLTLDYNGIDNHYGSQNFQTYNYGFYELNSRLTYGNAANNGSLKQAAVLFDSLATYNAVTSLVEWLPLSASQVILDSFTIYFTHHQLSAGNDSLKFTVFNTNSFQVNGSGASTSIQNNNLWELGITITTGSPLPASSTIVGNLGYVQALTVPVNLTLPAGQSFGIRVDYTGDTLQDKFELISGYRESCSGACGAVSSAVKNNSYAYINYGVASGINSSPFDCNQNGIGGEEDACERSIIQNLSIYPHVTVTTSFGAAFASDTLALCDVANVLSINAYGASPPLTYQWAPPAGLSSTTAANPTVSVGTATTYSVTVTDANNSIASASVIVSPDPGLCEQIDTISGTVYSDINLNGLQDVNEPGYSNCFIRLSNSSAAYTDNNGRYTIHALHSQQPHVITAFPYDYFGYNLTFSQPATGSYTISDPSLTNFDNYNIGLVIPPDSSNSTVYAYRSWMPPRPGFQNEVTFYCRNYEGNTFTGNLVVQYDSVQAFVYSLPTPDAVDAVNHTLTFNIDSITANNTNYFYVTFNTPSTATLGTSITYSGQLTPDVAYNDIYPADNSYILEETIVGSYDPNDKAVNPKGIGPANSLRPENNELTYTVRFQNTGTFLAENVVIMDTMDTDLNINTLKVISASHAYAVSVNGRVVTFSFPQIMLPDSNADEPGSHGFIVYSIRTDSNVTHLSNIENTAYIYFDFNPPVVTNTTSNLIDFYLSNSMVENDKAELTVAPNPFTNELKVWVKAPGIEQYDLEVTTLLGQPVINVTNLKTSSYTLNTTNLPQGIYLLYVKANGNKLAAGKIIKQ